MSSLRIEPIDGLEAAEVRYVIELLAAMKPIEEIQDLFSVFTDGAKNLPRKTIYKISLQYAKQIREQNKAYLENVDGNPLAHRRIRLDILYKILLDAMEKRNVNSFKITPEEYEVVKKADNATALNAVKLAMLELTKAEELQLLSEKLRGGLAEDGNIGWEIDDGLSENTA